ncbi:hypothetical protein KIW84_022917 [Lathyrus oleraceus]|uniref:Major facilitator superfamily (MFS) profile domain-containing protein n=1 Tax=Pisum sativum TaxID=3888 RepID=A0A9D4YHH2_PEA|nr:hypothetical protein KIW84_022917 [Pisum sativum]
MDGGEVDKHGMMQTHHEALNEIIHENGGDLDNLSDGNLDNVVADEDYEFEGGEYDEDADGDDKSGRRLLLIVSSYAMALSLLVVSISFYLKEYISPDSDLYATLSLVSVAGVVVMVIAFSLGLGAMPWIIMSEILPINIKGLAGSFATLANWFFSWLVTLTANLLLDWSSGGTFTIYTAVCVFTAGFVAIWVPETKGKTLEEIQQFFR